MKESLTKITMADVARRARVSKNAVSLALRNDPQIPLATRKRIQKLAQSMGYSRDPVVGELMARLRMGKSHPNRMNLVLFNGHAERRALDKHPTLPAYVRGCRKRARELGCSLDEMWLHEAGHNGKRMIQILRSRGIRGGIIVGLMENHVLPDWFLPVLDEFPMVVTGVRTSSPALSFSCVDHYILALRAMAKARELGYRRPGLVLDDVIDQLVEGRFSAGYIMGQKDLKKEDRIKPFYKVRKAMGKPELFTEWFEHHQPDVIFTLYNIVFDWFKEMGLFVPDDVGVIQLEWRESRPHISGWNQHNDVTGASAVDLLMGMIFNGEKGIPDFPLSMMVGPSWMDGKTVKKQSGQFNKMAK